MSYQIYTTDAIILKRITLETDAVYVLFTLDFGLIYAKAVSVRKSSSKLKFSLQQYFYSNVSLVKGRSGFKITSAIFYENFLNNSISKTSKVAVANICKTLERLVSGQEKHSQLFEIVKKGLFKLTSVSVDDVPFVEIMIILLILYHLGYVDMASFDQNILNASFDEETILIVKNSYVQILKTVNKGLSESHL